MRIMNTLRYVARFWRYLSLSIFNELHFQTFKKRVGFGLTAGN